MADSKTSALTSYSNPDPVNDVLPIVDNTNSTLKKISRNNLLGITSTPVGINDIQTLTQKTFTSPTIASPVLSGTITGTYTLAGTPTLPSSVVTLTGSQTLTNKILTSPTINAPTITNASITADAITGFSSANTGNIYGVSITAGVITSASVGTSAIVAAAVTAAKMQFGMVRQRQGGTTGDATWQTAGTSNTDTSAKAIFIQTGVGNIAGAETTVTFPVAFTQIPVVLGAPQTATSTNTSFRVRAVTTTNFIAALINDGTTTTQATSENFGWMAIGQ